MEATDFYPLMVNATNIYIYIYIYNINMIKCQYQQCKRVLNTRVERIKQNGNQIKSTHISY